VITGPSIRVGEYKPLPEFGSQGNLEKGKAIWNFVPCSVAAGLVASCPVMLPTDEMEAASGEDVLYLFSNRYKIFTGPTWGEWTVQPSIYKARHTRRLPYIAFIRLKATSFLWYREFISYIYLPNNRHS